MLVDDYLPVYDISDSVATVVQADVAATWNALMEVDLIDVGRRRPLIAVLGALRGLPDIMSHLLHGEAPPQAPTTTWMSNVGATLASISRRKATKSCARCWALHRARTSPVATLSAAKRSSVPLRR